MDIRLEKANIRKKILSIRDSLSKEERERYSLEILKKFFSLKETEKSENFFIFVNFRTEVNTIPIIERLIQDKKKVIVPYTDTANKKLILCSIDSLSELRLGSYGILEPDIKIAKRVKEKDVDIAVIPGSVFDSSGGRVGYGGGFYDRIIPRLKPNVPKIALAFEVQIVDRVPMGYYDQKMDIIITEKRIIRIKND